VRRREFIALVGGMAAWPLYAYGQQSALPTIGFLNAGTRTGREHFVGAFHEGLKEGSFIEGRNVTVEYRWADDRYDRLSALADELVRLTVSVIVPLVATPSHSQPRPPPAQSLLFLATRETP